MSRKRVNKEWFKDIESVEEISRQRYGFETKDTITLDDIPDWVSIDKVAKKFDCCKSTVRTLIREKKLHGKKIGGKWKVLASSLAEYLLRAS